MQYLKPKIENKIRLGFMNETIGVYPIRLGCMIETFGVKNNLYLYHNSKNQMETIFE